MEELWEDVGGANAIWDFILRVENTEETVYYKTDRFELINKLLANAAEQVLTSSPRWNRWRKSCKNKKIIGWYMRNVGFQELDDRFWQIRDLRIEECPGASPRIYETTPLIVCGRRLSESNLFTETWHSPAAKWKALIKSIYLTKKGDGKLEAAWERIFLITHL